jgi:hypothetical protein
MNPNAPVKGRARFGKPRRWHDCTIYAGGFESTVYVRALLEDGSYATLLLPRKDVVRAATPGPHKATIADQKRLKP